MLVIRKEIVVLPRVKPTVIEGVPMVIRVRYSEPKVNQYNGSIVNGVPRVWSRGIHR